MRKIDKEVKVFSNTVQDIKKLLNWTITIKCPDCKKNVRDDAFEIIATYGCLTDWFCPECMVNNKSRKISWGTHGHYGLSEDEKDLLEPPKGEPIYLIEFLNRFGEYRRVFLEGYLQGQYYLLPWTRDDYYDDGTPLTDDISIATLRLYIAVELLLPVKVKELLAKKGTPEDVISLLVDTLNPNVRNYINILESLKVKIEDRYLKRLIECQNIRNKIVHKGYSPAFKEYAFMFKSVGEFIYKLETFSS